MVQAVEQIITATTGTASLRDYAQVMRYHTGTYTLVNHGPSYAAHLSEELLKRYTTASQAWSELEQRFPDLGATMEHHKYVLDLWALECIAESHRWESQEETTSLLNLITKESLLTTTLPQVLDRDLRTSFVLQGEHRLKLRDMLPWIYSRVGLYPSWVHDLLYQKSQGHMSKTRQVKLDQRIKKLQDPWNRRFIPRDAVERRVQRKPKQMTPGTDKRTREIYPTVAEAASSTTETSHETRSPKWV